MSASNSIKRTPDWDKSIEELGHQPLSIVLAAERLAALAKNSSSATELTSSASKSVGAISFVNYTVYIIEEQPRYIGIGYIDIQVRLQIC